MNMVIAITNLFSICINPIVSRVITAGSSSPFGPGGFVISPILLREVMPD